MACSIACRTLELVRSSTRSVPLVAATDSILLNSLACCLAKFASPLSFGSASDRWVPCGSTRSMPIPLGVCTKNRKSGRRAFHVWLSW